AEYEGPGLTHAQQFSPGDPASRRRSGILVVTVNMLELRRAQPLFPRRDLIYEPPEDEPDQSERAGRHKGRLPAVNSEDRGNHQWRHDLPDVRARVEDAGRKRPFPFGEPFGHRFYGRREVTCFAETQRGPGDREPRGGPGQPMPHRRKAPADDGDRIADLRPYPIDDGAEEQQAGCIEELEDAVDRPERRVAPSEIMF